MLDDEVAMTRSMPSIDEYDLEVCLHASAIVRVRATATAISFVCV